MNVFSTDLEVIETTEAGKTYKISADSIQGYTDNLEALQQAIDKILNTEQYEYPIYSFSYGIMLDDLIGKDRAYVKAELKRRIIETLSKDDRVNSVDNFTFTAAGDSMLCTFSVTSIYGSVTISKEVDI